MAEYFAGGRLRFVNGEWQNDDGDIIEISRVRHGEWELVEYQCTPLDTDQALVCTECGFAHQNDDWYNYCPNCGAKMDGSSNEE